MASYYKKFEPFDILNTVVYTEPRINATSGTNGWRSNLGGVSGSVSLYGGLRARSDVKGNSTSGISIYPLYASRSTYTIDGCIFKSGSYPITSSIQVVKVRTNTDESSDNPVTKENWYKRHYQVIERLYDYYHNRDADYFTGSYDYYSLYFRQNASFQAPVVAYTASYLSTMTSSFTVEAWIKPTYVTSSTQDFTIAGQRTKWKLYVTGTNGKLVFTDFRTILTSSTTISAGVWTHVLFSSTATSGTFYINNSSDSQLVFTGTLLSVSASITSSHLAVGAEYVLSASTIGTANQGFSGFVYETKVWDVARTAAQISSSWNRTLKSTESGSVNLVHYSRFNDGPLSTHHGFSQGSGSFDYSSSSLHGKFINFNSVLPRTPMWQPNDNIDFTTYKTKINDSVNMMKIINIPSVISGRQIVTGSVHLVCRGYDNQGIVRVIKDNGRGALYISGSLTRNFGGNEEYTGNTWRKVGNVFYSEGLICITDPSMLDFGEVSLDSHSNNDLLQVDFNALNPIPSTTLLCRLDAGEYNCSHNPTFSYFDPQNPEDITDDKYIVRGDTTYVTAVGIYNEERVLVAVAKLAQPIRKRLADKLLLKIGLDF